MFIKKIKSKIIKLKTKKTYHQNISKNLVVNCILIPTTVLVTIMQVFLIIGHMLWDVEYIDFQTLVVFMITSVTTLYILKNENDIDITINHVDNISEIKEINAFIKNSGVNGQVMPVICLKNVGNNNYNIKYIRAFDLKSKQQKRIIYDHNKMVDIKEKNFLSSNKCFSLAIGNVSEMTIVICMTRLSYEKKVILKIQLESFEETNGNPKYTIVYGEKKFTLLEMS